VLPLTDAAAPDKARGLFQAIQLKFGMVPNIFRMMGQAPDVLKSTLDFDGAINHDLELKLRDLAYLKTSQLNGCHYCLHYHTAIGRKAGLSDAQIKDLGAVEQSGAYSELEKNVLRFAEQWTRQGKVEAGLMQQLARSLSPAQLVTLAATVGLANWTNRFNESFDVQLP
jgi:uncharacterized peroxidase-related enzyme